MKLRVLSLFAGIGGFDAGLEATGGFATVAFCEINEKCRSVLLRHWPEVPIYEDVRWVTRQRLEADGIAADVVVGGFPCQPFSSAARGRNNKTDLWPEMLRVVIEMRPRWVAAENVPGLGDHGIDRVCSDLEREGYTVWPIDMDTAPPGRHRGRRRFIILANADSEGESRRAEHAQMACLPEVSKRRWTNDAPPLGMDDGVQGRMDALRQLGNSISPWASEMIGRAILQEEGVRP